MLLSTAVNASFVAQARHNLRVLPLLIVAGTAGAALAWQALVRSRFTLPPEADPPGSQIRVSRRVPALHLLRRGHAEQVQ